jgi:hypothetical protein
MGCACTVQISFNGAIRELLFPLAGRKEVARVISTPRLGPKLSYSTQIFYLNNSVVMERVRCVWDKNIGTLLCRVGNLCLLWSRGVRFYICSGVIFAMFDSLLDLVWK